MCAGQAPENPRVGAVQIGMTPAQVRDVLGPPPAVARQVYYRGSIEQWLYQGKRVEFLFQAGREPKVRAVLTPTAPR